jgi:Holliday junction DNA helicase RuvA
MIGRINGLLVEKNPPQIVVMAHGLGYEVDVPMSTFCELPALGQEITLLTHLVVREDAQLLYGFSTGPERQAFRALIKISGVGPRIALAVLSGMTVDDLTQAVANQQSGRLQKVPGIGKKTAERLLLELKGRLGDALPGAGGVGMSGTDPLSDTLHALVALGYSEREADAAVRALPPGLSVDDGIRQALKSLARG